MSAELRKEETYFFAVSVCVCFERPVEVAQMKTTHSRRVVVTLQKKLLVSAETLLTHFDAKLVCCHQF